MRFFTPASLGVSTGFIAIFAIACTTQPLRAPSSEKPAFVTIIATTDFHGALEPEVTDLGNGQKLVAGGPQYLSAYLKILRKKTPGPIVHVDGGDLFQGSMASNLFEGAPVVRLYNYFGVAAAAVGNHEFDFGPVGPKSVPRDPGDDPVGALKQRASEAKFPFLGINILDASGKNPSWLKPSVVVEQQGVKIGIVGATSINTPNTTNGANLVGLRIVNSLEPIKSEAQRLRTEEKVDVVVVTMHEGGTCRDNSLAKVDDLSSCDNGDGIAIAKALPEGLVDVIIAGHTHAGIAKRIGKTVIIQAFSHGMNIGWAHVPLTPGQTPTIEGFEGVCGTVATVSFGKTCIGSVAKKMGATSSAPATFLGEPVIADDQALAIIKPEMDKVHALEMSPLGADVTATISRSFLGESALGNLMADALKADYPKVDLGMVNGGGLRADLPAGALKYGDVFNVLPFDNQTALLKVPGAALQKMVQLGLSGNNGSLSWSGLTFKAEGCQVKEISVNGAPLDPAKTYVIATSDYLATGGSNFNTLGILPSQIQVLWDHDNLLRESVVAAIASWKRTLKPEDFYDPKNPRQQLSGACATGSRPGN